LLKTSYGISFTRNQKAAYFRNMNIVGSRNLFQQFLWVFIKHFDLEKLAFGMNDNGMLTLLYDKDARLVELLHELKNAETAYIFVKSDKELRLKVPDIWKLQCNQSEQALNELHASLQLYGASIGAAFPQLNAGE
jgi:hypothetical protein